MMNETEIYTTLTRVTVMSKFVSPSGEVSEIHAKDVPAALHAVTNGRFKLAWAPHVYARAHITFEQLDDEHRFTEMRGGGSGR